MIPRLLEWLKDWAYIWRAMDHHIAATQGPRSYAANFHEAIARIEQLPACDRSAMSNRT